MKSQLNNKHILITGGAGFIGSHLVEELLKYDCQIRILDNFSTGKLSNVSQNPNVEIVKRDIRDLESIKPCFKGIDYVFHLAAVTSVPLCEKKRDKASEVISGGATNIILSTMDKILKKVINASSCAVYGDIKEFPIKETKWNIPISYYGLLKDTAERMFEDVNMFGRTKTVSLRLFNVYGKGQSKETIIARFIQLAKQHKPLEIYGDGKATRDFVYIKDVVKAFILTAEKDVSGVYNIGSGKETTVKELAELINELTGNKAGIVYKKPRAGDIKRSWADISKAKSIGYEPKYSLEMGLKEIIGGIKC